MTDYDDDYRIGRWSDGNSRRMAAGRASAASSSWRLSPATKMAVASDIAAIRQRFQIAVESREIAGVKVFIVTPADLPESNRDRLLVHVMVARHQALGDPLPR